MINPDYPLIIEVKNKKEKLIKNIEELINKFEQETQTRITSISFNEDFTSKTNDKIIRIIVEL